jgi:site-specific DNA-cytosine methylase
LKQDLRTLKYWKKTMPGHSYVKAAEGNCYTCYKISFHKPAMTLTASGQVTHPSEPRKLTEIEFCRIQSFPDDYDFDGTSAHYTCGMSVPPFMMQRIANQIAIQWFKK